MKRHWLFVSMVALAGAASAADQAARYSVTDLGIVGPAQTTASVQTYWVANRGIAAGGAIVAEGNEHAMLWFQGLRMDLGTLGLRGSNSLAFSVNDNGQVVGQAETWTSYPYHEDLCGFAAAGLLSYGRACVPFVWQSGAMRPLATLGGFNGVAISVNAGGDVAGWAENGVVDSGCPAQQKLQFKPVVWQKGGVQELATAAGDRFGITNFITDNGTVVGASGECAPYSPIVLAPFQALHALMWQGGKVTDLGTLGGSGHGFGIVANGGNNQGQVVGASDLEGDQVSHAFLWTKEKGMTDLGTLPGDAISAGVSINDAGQIVGVSLDANFDLRAAMWKDGVASDLNDLIPADSPLYLLLACSVNAQGQFVGLAADAAGNLHGYLATPAGAVGELRGGHERWSLSAEGRNVLSRLPYGRFVPRRRE